MAKRSLDRAGRTHEEICKEILRRLEDGEYLRQICNGENGLPSSAATVLNWIHDSEEFAERYARAREIGWSHMAEQILEIADEDDDPQRSRVRVDTRKWLLSKVLPKIYGDKQAVELSGANGGPIEFTFTLDHAGDDSEAPEG